MLLSIRETSWEDETISGISKQNEAGTTINSDFTKISMCKLVLFANAKSKADYFFQQSKFVNEEGGKDLYAELSTKVEGTSNNSFLPMFFFLNLTEVFIITLFLTY